ncbi:MAG: ABC transporter permease [Hyphomonadaceae bacterium]
MMRTADLIGSAARALRSNPLRSALTALGVIIGVASVIAMVSIGRGAQSSVESSISSLGSNLLVIVPGALRGGGGVRQATGSFDSLTLADADAIEREVEGLAAVSPVQRSRAQIVANGANWNTSVEGAFPDYLTARDWRIDEGRFFEDREERQARTVAVLGATVAKQLFPNESAVGQKVRVNGALYTVIGTLISKGQTGFGQDQDDIVIAPFSTVKRRISGRQRRADSVSQITVKAVSEADLAHAEDDINALLRQRHRVAEGEEDFTVQNLNSIMQAATEATQTLTVMIACIAGVSLLVGGIGIMNIMLVSVTERTREIGLRKALGARKGDILRQFGLEAVALSLAGGVVGLVIGVGGAWIATQIFKLPFALALDTALLAIGFSGFVGVVFGAYPAWRAAQLDPIEALRRE